MILVSSAIVIKLTHTRMLRHSKSIEMASFETHWAIPWAVSVNGVFWLPKEQ
jgi:hypothetical protein